MDILRFFLTAIIVFQSLFWLAPTAAASSQGVVIYQVMAGEAGAATKEFVTLYNNTDEAIDMTGWCIGSKSVAQLACLSGGPQLALWLPARGATKIASTTYAEAHPLSSSMGDHYDAVYSPARADRGSIVGSSDTIKLFDPSGSVIDMIEWGQVALEAGAVWQRTASSPGVLVDTDEPADFTKSTAATPAVSSLYEVVVPVDVCPNLPGNDSVVPEGYLLDGAGNCMVDMCTDIAGLQVELPAGYEKTVDGVCRLVIAPLQLTEVLPNAKGTDVGHEFVELFNPTDRTVDLSLYQLQVGATLNKTHEFPAGSSIDPFEHKIFYDTDIPFSLVNTSGKVALVAIDGRVVSVTELYESPGDDMAWAVVDGVWQYTDRPTPGSANMVSWPEMEGGYGSANATLAPCPAGKYRHPLTNRCRTIETDVAVLASCDTDQYRNPETGRCRKIAAVSALTPCKEGQYRSEETNRCRTITAASELKPCAEGQERNVETNRCRKVASGSVPAAAFAVKPVDEGAKAFVGWWALGGVGALALGYAGWEWRREIGSVARKLSLKGLTRR